MPPATRTTRRSLRSRRSGSPDAESDTKSGFQSNTDSILKNPSSSGSDVDPTDGQSKKKTAKANRSVTFSLGNDQSLPASPTGSETSSLPGKGSEAGGAASARARRSERRQAQIEKDPVKKGPAAMKKGTNKKDIEANTKNTSASKKNSSKKGIGGKEEEAVKVKLNTGTLYLYRGVNRRAVFVRRV